MPVIYLCYRVTYNRFACGAPRGPAWWRRRNHARWFRHPACRGERSPAPGDRAEGFYPLTVPYRGGNTTPVVRTDGRYKYVGRLLAAFDHAGRVTGHDDSSTSCNGVASGVFSTDLARVSRLWGRADEALTPGSPPESPFEEHRGVRPNNIGALSACHLSYGT